MSLEDLLKKAKKAHKEKKAAEPAAPKVVQLPTAGQITEYGDVPPEELERAEELHRQNPDDPEAQVYLAFLHYAGKRYEQAIEHFTALLAKGFKPANQHFYLGNCAYKKNDHAEARRQWELCLQAEPEESIGRMVKRRLTWVQG